MDRWHNTVGVKGEDYTVYRKGKAFMSAALLIIFSIQLLLSIEIASSQTVGTYHPSGYNLIGATSYTSGALTHLQSDDSVYMSFGSYFSGTDTSDFVDNDASDVDSSADKGTHDNFSAQQSGPDSTYDTLTEENTASTSNTTLIDAESFEGTWPPTGWIETDAWNNETDQAYYGTSSADFDGPLFGTSSGDLDTPDLDCSDANAIYVGFWYRDDGLDADDFLLKYYDGSNWDNIVDLGSTTQENQWLHYQQKITDSRYFVSTFKVRWSAVSVGSLYGEHIYVDLVTVKKEVGLYNYELDLEVQWTNADYDETNEEVAIYADKGNNTHSLDAAGGYMMIGDGTANWGSTTGTISFWIKWNSVGNRPWGQHENMEIRFSGLNIVVDWGAAGSITSSTSFTAGKWYFIAIAWDENTDDLYLHVGDQDNAPTEDTHITGWTDTVSDEGVTENNFMASKGGVDPTDGHGDDLRYWNIYRTLTEIQSDYDTELTGSETNLRSYFNLHNNFDDMGPDNNDGSGVGSYSFSSDVPFDAPPTENIRVDVWNGTAWQNLFTDLTNGWNNISVSSYLTSSTLTIRFKGGTEAGDATQDSWNMDVTLLHVWSDEYTTEVEFVGLSDTETWVQLEWSVDSAWTVGSVSVTLQLYNYSLGDYPTNGNGYVSYISSATANADETKNQAITVNPTHFRNSTGYWKVKVKGVKTTDTPFDFKADLIKCEITFAAPPDVAVLNVTKSLTSVHPGEIVRINVTVKNEGRITETFNVTLYYDNTEIGKQLVSSLAPSADTTLTFNWNTTGVAPDTYTIKAIADNVPGETDTADNTYVDGTLRVHIETPSQPFDWAILYALLAVFGLVFFSAVKLNRRKKIDTFSELFGMTHQQMIGKKMLLEIDPTSDYHKALLNFASEARNSSEPLFIFTSTNSALHSALPGSENVKFFLLTSNASSLQQINEKVTLLPAHDLSILLNASVEALKEEKEKTINMLFDNISSIIIRCGFEKTYSFMHFLLEAVSSPNATALFVFNPAAHDPEISSSIRGLFHNQLAYTKRGPKVGTL